MIDEKYLYYELLIPTVRAAESAGASDQAICRRADDKSKVPYGSNGVMNIDEVAAFQSIESSW